VVGEDKPGPNEPTGKEGEIHVSNGWRIKPSRKLSIMGKVTCGPPTTRRSRSLRSKPTTDRGTCTRPNPKTDRPERPRPFAAGPRRLRGPHKANGKLLARIVRAGSTTATCTNTLRNQVQLKKQQDRLGFQPMAVRPPFGESEGSHRVFAPRAWTLEDRFSQAEDAERQDRKLTLCHAWH